VQEFSDHIQYSRELILVESPELSRIQLHLHHRKHIDSWAPGPAHWVQPEQPVAAEHISLYRGNKISIKNKYPMKTIDERSSM
jgi:hypothetical protein